MLKITNSSPVLKSKTREGKDKMWQCHILNYKDLWYTQTSYWQTKNDGSNSTLQWSDPYEVKGKNVGRANETTPEEQALLEFERAIKKQKDKGYSEEGEESEILPLPMLAHKFSDRGHDVIWPALVQPKLNGQRMLFDGEAGWSRGGKIILPQVINHIQEALFGLPEGVILDGELILPDNVLLQETMKAVKKYRPGISERLQYWVYDLISPLPYEERLNLLNELIDETVEDCIILTPSLPVDNLNEVMKIHTEFTGRGFEGTMLRSGPLGYDIGHRNVQLQKIKDFVDGEFEIVNVVEGDGRFKGAAIFVCDNGFGEQFSCAPEGSMEVRREYFKERSNLVGKWLTIRYQELSNKKIPIFPIGISVRETKEGGY
jgi:DNA ligase-1